MGEDIDRSFKETIDEFVKLHDEYWALVKEYENIFNDHVGTILFLHLDQTIDGLKKLIPFIKSAIQKGKPLEDEDYEDFLGVERGDFKRFIIH